MAYTLAVETRKRTEFIDITDIVRKCVCESKLRQGVCVIYVPHTTAGVTINENADPSVREDIIQALEKLVPWRGAYSHSEGNAAAHIKASLVGSSTTVPVEESRLALGQWQGIYFAEFDGPRRRSVIISIK